MGIFTQSKIYSRIMTFPKIFYTLSIRSNTFLSWGIIFHLQCPHYFTYTIYILLLEILQSSSLGFKLFYDLCQSNDRLTLLDGEIFVDRSLWLSSVLESDIRKTPHRSGFTLNSSFKFLQDQGNCARYAVLFLVYLNTKDGLWCDSLSNELMIIIILITRTNIIKANKIIFWKQFIYGDWLADFLAPSGALKIGPSRYPTNPIPSIHI